jgi:hypothetical protein
MPLGGHIRHYTPARCCKFIHIEQTATRNYRSFSSLLACGHQELIAINDAPSVPLSGQVGTAADPPQ